MAENLLLAALPPNERERLDPFLEWVELEMEVTVIVPGEPIRNMYFPFDFITSTVQEMEDGSIIETGLMGIEGLVGIQLWLNVDSTPTRTMIQVPGAGHRMKSADFRREVMEKPSPLNHLVAKYVHAFLIMTSQVAACNRLHPIDQRLCRWLKLIHNRIGRDHFPMRQEFMAQMLGVQRATVSTAANMLLKAGLIEYVRGKMRILDADGLTAGSCECLELMEAQFDRVFEQPWLDLAKREQKNKPAGE